MPLQTCKRRNRLITPTSITNQNMQYKIEAIGSQFSDKAIGSLESRLNQQAAQGYKFHSVFHITKPGCLGLGTPTSTYLAVYVKD